ncbi:phosphoethanolamine transferase [Helicobacter felis]|uniref:phosphoethanolamine transferase n=2 Tax=Helicobacter felis TaxID=214 RepID=UPI000CEF1E56|nr:phosphoethanolamine transferase [Helicobacter felis]
MRNVVLDSRFFLMWLAPVAVAFFSANPQSQYGHFYVGKVAFYSLTLTFVIYYGLSLIKQRFVSQSIKNILLVLSLLFAFTDFFVSYYFKMAFTQSLVDTILSSHWAEIRSFFVSQGFSLVLPFFIAMATCVGVSLLPLSITISPKGIKAIFAVLLLVCALHAFQAYYVKKVDLRPFYGVLFQRVIPLVKEINLIAMSIRDHGRIQAMYDKLRQPLPKDYLQVDSNSVPNVVLIIGESASHHFMGLYGYPVQNTPFLSKLERERERDLFTFTDVISPFGGTMPVFQVLLNYSDVENKHIPWYLKENIGKILRAAGYTTFWLDNQDNWQDESTYANVYTLTSHSFDYTYWTNQGWKNHDQVLINTYNHEVKSKLRVKNFILFHLMGNHLIFNQRFPKSFAKFTPKDLPYTGLKVQNMADKQIVADYVNSLYYTDYILQEIFDLFKDKNALIVYLSDHGQSVYEDWHGYEHSCSKSGVEIPFVIYVTEKFKQKYPQKVKAIAQAVNKPFMTDDLIHSLLPLMGIHTKENIESKNLFSPAFDVKRKRVFCGSVYKP